MGEQVEIEKREFAELFQAIERDANRDRAALGLRLSNPAEERRLIVILTALQIAAMTVKRARPYVQRPMVQ